MFCNKQEYILQVIGNNYLCQNEKYCFHENNIGQMLFVLAMSWLILGILWSILAMVNSNGSNLVNIDIKYRSNMGVLVFFKYRTNIGKRIFRHFIDNISNVKSIFLQYLCFIVNNSECKANIQQILIVHWKYFRIVHCWNITRTSI